MSERHAVYLVKGKQVMIKSKKGIVEKIYFSGLVKVRLADGLWIGPAAKLSECEEAWKPLVID